MARTTFWFSERIQFYQNDKRLLLNKNNYDKNAYLRIFLLALERYIYHIYYFEKNQFPDTKTIQKSYILKLNFDILMEIKKYLSPLDCFNLMLTCHQMWYNVGYCEPLLYQVPIYDFAMKRNTPQYKPCNKKNINLYNTWYYGYESIEDSPNPCFTKSIITFPIEKQQQKQQKQPCAFLLNIYYSLLKEISCWINNEYEHHRRYNVFPHGYNTASRCVDIKYSIQIQEYFKIIGMSPMYDFILRVFNTKMKIKERYQFEEGVGSFNSHEVRQIYSCLRKLQPFWKPFESHLDLDVVLTFFEDCLNDNIEFIVNRFCISAVKV